MASALSTIATQRSTWLALAAVLLGVLLRVVWSADMEYKLDEHFTFQMSAEIGKTHQFPWLGLPTSHTIRHPGGTVWSFWGVAQLFDAQTPEELGRACQLCNGLALILLLAFIFHSVPQEQREPWLWAAALAAFNPIQVLFHRKIWSPSIMPVFIVIFLWCWWYRRRPLGAFLWGLIGTLLIQLYPGCMFLTGGFFLWAVLFQRKEMRWGWWLIGAMIGAATLIPWAFYAWTEIARAPVSQRNYGHLFEGKFWMRWFSEPLGVSLQYSLGRDFFDFLRYPLIFGTPTYLAALFHLTMLLSGGMILFRGVRRLWKNRREGFASWIGASSETAFSAQACMLGFGIVITLSMLPVHRHYMIVTFPFMFLWLAIVALRHASPSRIGGRVLLTVLCVSHLAISASFLGYVHANPRRIGDGLEAYGVPFSAQPNGGATAAKLSDFGIDENWRPSWK